MTEAEALQWLYDRVPLLEEPAFEEIRYTRALARWNVSATEWRLNRAAEDLCRQKEADSAGYHADGVYDSQEQQIPANWRRLAEYYAGLAAQEELVTDDASSMTRTRSVANQPVW